MRIRASILTSLFAIFVTGLASAGVTLELKDGTTWIGEVVRVGDQEIQFQVHYPESSVQSIQRERISPRSLYEILERGIDGKDPQAHLALAATCKDLGLYAHAIAELRTAQALDPKLKPQVAERIAKVEETLADSLVQRAKDALAEDNDWATAKLNLSVVLGQYSKTPAAKEATAMMGRIGEMMARRTAAESTAPKRPSRDEKAFLKDLGKAEKLLNKAKKLASKYSTVSNSSRERKDRAKVVGYLEEARKEISELPATEDEALLQKSGMVEAEVSKNLHDSYVLLGTLYLNRLALPAAEEANAQACRIDPESGGCRRLQDLIVHARIANG